MEQRRITVSKTKITNDHGEKHTYVFEEAAIDAVNAALAINRPLLIRGEPGAGKSQLAKAAAKALERTYIPFVVNSGSEAEDLLWSFDAVARLADAQMEGALCKDRDDGDEACRKLVMDEVRQKLALANYIKPGPLWAALSWRSAKEQYADSKYCHNSPLLHYLGADKAENNGVVVLIDEIDKADSNLPNGLLEVLGANRFHPEGLAEAVEVDKDGIKPLIIITTNEERILPDAFIRRCLSVTLGMPKDRAGQLDYLLAHGRPNFKELDRPLDEKQTILEAAATMLLEDREQADNNNLHPLPGQAEYFDLLRGIQILRAEQSQAEVAELIASLARFTTKKHPDFPASKGKQER